MNLELRHAIWEPTGEHVWILDSLPSETFLFFSTDIEEVRRFAGIYCGSEDAPDVVELMDVANEIMSRESS